MSGARIKGPGPLEAIIADPDKYTLKRAAWAYGCAAKGSEIEAALLAVLIGKLVKEHPQTVTIKFAPVEPGTGINGSDFHPTPFLPPFSVPIGKPILREDPMEAFGSGKPERFERQVMGRPICLTEGCGIPAASGSDYCPPCRSIRSGHGL